MGRSVSYPRGALVAFTEFDWVHECGECDGYGTDELGSECLVCHGSGTIYMDDYDWDDFCEDLTYRARSLFPSLSPDDRWIGHEDRVLASNGFAHFGVSEYCGTVAVWLVPRGDAGGSGEALARNWINGVARRFKGEFATMHRLGVMSNGGAVYERIEA